MIFDYVRDILEDIQLLVTADLDCPKNRLDAQLAQERIRETNAWLIGQQDQRCEGPDDCDAHHPCIKHAAGAPSLQTWEESDLELMDAEESKQR